MAKPPPDLTNVRLLSFSAAVSLGIVVEADLSEIPSPSKAEIKALFARRVVVPLFGNYKAPSREDRMKAVFAELAKLDHT